MRERNTPIHLTTPSLCVGPLRAAKKTCFLVLYFSLLHAMCTHTCHLLFFCQAILENVDERAAKKAFSLSLDQFGPYTLDYTRNGR